MDIKETSDKSQSILIDDVLIEELDAPVLDDFDQIPIKKQCSALPHSKSGRKIIPKLPWSPSRPGPSAYNIDNSADNDSDNDDDTAEPCCVCHKQSPPKLKSSNQLVIVNWAKCSKGVCPHWVHLKFCHKKISVSKNDIFLCPCCDQGKSEQ